MLSFSKKKKYDITFICRCGKDHFAEPILKELEKKYSIQYLYPEHKRDYSHRQIRGNVIWVEWALKFAYLVSRKKWENKKVFIRLHRWEIDTDFMKKINWENIDKVIFVNKKFENLFKQRVNYPVETITISNTISINDFPLYDVVYRHTIICYSISYIKRKGYLELITFFDELIQKDSSFKLTILARNPETEEEQQYLKLIENKIKELNIYDSISIIKREKNLNLVNDRGNISQYLSKHSIIVSFSKNESFQYTIAEGLLSGLQGFYNAWQNPLIDNFWGKWGYNSEDEMIDAIIEWSKLLPSEKQSIAKENRKYVIDNFGSENIGEKYDKELFS